MSRVRDSWLLRVLAENQLTAHFQPIVVAAHPEQVYAYECLLRGHLDEQLIYPGKLLDAAKRMDALFQLDRRAREAAIRTAANHNIQQKIFINFTPTAIYDPEYCLRSTIELITQLNFSQSRSSSRSSKVNKSMTSLFFAVSWIFTARRASRWPWMIWVQAIPV